MAERTSPPGRPYCGEHVTVYYEARRCAHFGECVRGLPEVFDVTRRPWILPDNGPADRVAEMVRRCPTGALHYADGDVPPEEPDRPTRVRVVPDGPLLLRGDLSIDTPAGVVHDVRAAVCRCGDTRNSPFCDHACAFPATTPRGVEE